MKCILPALAVAVVFSCSTKRETTDQTSNQDTIQSSTKAQVVVGDPPPISIHVDSGTFIGFLELFRSRVTQLPEWAVSFITDDYVGHFTPGDILETGPIILVTYVRFVPVGPGMDNLYAASFTIEGKLLSDVELGRSYPSSGPGGGGQDFDYTYETDRNVIYVTNRTTDWNEEKQEEFTIESWNPYYLADDGQIVQGRKYPEISERYLESGDLTRFSKEELKIMRNEIFAVYGYIFKTEPLKSYYNATPWYVAERDNVDDYLSEIEKANVALIKEVENSK